MNFLPMIWLIFLKSLLQIFFHSLLKGTVSRDFLLQVFSMNHLPQVPENKIRVISKFSKVRRDIRKSKCTTGINNAAQILPQVPLVFFISVANLTPVSTILARRQICPPVKNTSGNLPPISTTPAVNLPPVRCQQHRWQIIGTVSDCSHFKLNLKKKLYLYINSTIPKCIPTK
jgi:hypothetical protein